MLEYLFIGGHQDGKRINLSECKPVLLNHMVSPGSYLDDSGSFVSEEYVPVRLREGDEILTVFARPVDERSVISMLIDNYQRKSHRKAARQAEHEQAG